MGENKRKSRDESKPKQNESRKKTKQSKPHFNNKKKKNIKSRKRTGPVLPSALKKEVDRLNNKPFDSDIESDEVNGDVYEYEEEVAQEESQKNRRFDSVDNFEYQLPEDFEDEDVKSDDDDDDGEEEEEEGKTQEEDAEEEDDGRHARMLEGITGMPSGTFEGKKPKNNIVISEAYPESEFNPSRDVLEGSGGITIEDLLDPLQGKAGYSKLRKRTQQMERKSKAVEAPLPKPIREKLERKAAYEQSKKDITNWEPLVKRNREAPTLYFDKDIDLNYSTVGAIASEFEPRTDFEKKIASLVNDDKIMEAHKNDGARLLEFNEVSVEDEKERQNRIAKMRSLLFLHEMKKKRVKKIKSKTYHRLLKKDRLKAAALDIQMDPEAAKEQAMKQEYKRAEERMTLKHKNSSKWAKRVLQRGLDVQDEGTRSAITEQLHQHALLTRKMNSMKDSSSSSDESSSDDGDDNLADSDHDVESKTLTKAQEKTRKVMEEGDEEPKKGLFSLPFMARALKKREEEAYEEAEQALKEYEQKLEGTTESKNTDVGTITGRRVFGALNKQTQNPSKNIGPDRNYNNSDSEDDSVARENFANDEGNNDSQKDVHVDSVSTFGDAEIRQEPLFKNFEDIVKDPGPKTTYEVSIFASGTWKKMGSGKEADSNSEATKPDMKSKDTVDDEKETGEDSDTESEGHMVDGVLSSGSKPAYKLPSQAELIRQAFAGDDVEEEFEKEKLEILNKENPEPEKPMLIPGWGQWTRIQKKKGLPSWMIKEHDDANRKRQEALKRRKDANYKHVIISEKPDKKADKLHAKSLPYPFTSKEVYEQSIRMPIGPEFNPATAIGDLIRPEVVKKPGIVIKPIKFEEVNPHEKSEDQKLTGQKQKTRKGKNNKSKPVNIKS